MDILLVRNKLVRNEGHTLAALQNCPKYGYWSLVFVPPLGSKETSAPQVLKGTLRARFESRDVDAST